MKVSVVVAAYNEGRWIGACLESLVAQTHSEYEVIVVDDGSTDETAAIAADFGVRVVRTRHRGAGAARDTGGRAAAGDVLVFLDADEIYAPQFVERLTAPLKDPAVRATFPGGMTCHNPFEGLAPGWLVVRGVRPGSSVPVGGRQTIAKAVRRLDFEHIGGYPHAGYGEDRLFTAAVGAPLVVPDALWSFTVPTRSGEVLAKARWIGRGPLFDQERPSLWRLLPPWSWLRACRLILLGGPKAAYVQLLYDAGRVLGFVESRVRPELRNVA